MEEKEETIKCRHCKRDILKGTIMVHEVRCERLITVCRECGEPVPKTGLDQHKEDAHSKVPCPECGMLLERKGLDSHKTDDCPNRPIPCEYCEVDCLASNVEAHQEACGSRTEQCPVCQHFILIRMLKMHAALHEKNVVVKPATPAAKNRNVVLNNLLTPKAFKDQAVEPEFPRFGALDGGYGALHDPSFNSNANLPEMITKLACDFCGEKIDMYLLNEHELLCKGKSGDASKTFPIADKSALPPLDRFDSDENSYWSQYETRVVKRSVAVTEVLTEEEVSIPCEICGVPFPIDCLELHQVACKFNATDISQTAAVAQPSSSPIPALIADEDSFPASYASDLPAEIPCEHCGLLIATAKLQLHEVGCVRDQAYRDNMHNRAANYPNDTYNRIFDANGARPKQPKQQPVAKPINNRIENPIQRDARLNVLQATENRIDTNPQKPVHQSQYKVVRLEDGTELLKKTNVAFKNEAFHRDIGHVLGRSDRFHDDNNVSPVKCGRNDPAKRTNVSFENEAAGDPFHGHSIPRDERDRRSARPPSSFDFNPSPFAYLQQSPAEMARENARVDHLDHLAYLPPPAYNQWSGRDDDSQYKGAKPKRPLNRH